MTTNTSVQSIQKVYICGKMTGLPDFNRPAFHQAAQAWRQEGCAVFNPAEITGPDDWTWSDYMRGSLTGMLRCDTLYVLNGYTSSKGANIEIQLAAELGMNILFESANPTDLPRLSDLN